MTDRTVLVIDFEPTRLKATRELLLRAGFDVASAANSNELTTALQAQLPPVVLIEPMLPGHDGFTICRSLKSRSGGSTPHVIIGARIFRGQRYKQMAKDAGADIFLHRPEHDPLLVEVLTQMIGAPARPAAAAANTAAATSDPLELDFPRPTAPLSDRGPLDDLDWDRFEQQLDSVFEGITTKESEVPTGPASAEQSSSAFEASAYDPQLLVESAIEPSSRTHTLATAPTPEGLGPTAPTTESGSAKPSRSRTKLLVAAAAIAVFGAAAAMYFTLDLFGETPVRVPPKPEPPVSQVQPDSVAIDPALPTSDAASSQAEVAGDGSNSTGVQTGESTWPNTAPVDIGTPPARPVEAIEQRPLTLEPKQAFKPKPSSERRTEVSPAAKPGGARPEPAVTKFNAPPSANSTTPTTLTTPATLSPQPEPIVEVLEPIVTEPEPKVDAQQLTEQNESTDDFNSDGLFDEPAPDGPMLAGVDEVTRPELIASSRVEPSYPIIAKQARKGGSVTMQAVVKADGTVGEVRVLREPDAGLGLGKAAVSAVKRWRYKPGTLKGKPVDTYMSVVVTFKP